MAAAHIGVQYLEDEDFERMVAERRAQPRRRLSVGDQ
jgi:hypothetical protein